MITIPLWLFIVLIITNSITLTALFLIIYFICGVHDLIVSDKVAAGKYEDCPYFIEKDLPKDDENV